MLVISQRQLSQLDKAALDEFHLRLICFIKEAFQEKLGSVSDSSLENYIKISHDKSIAHGISSEKGVAMWIYLDVATNGKFIELEEVRGAFSDIKKSEQHLADIFNRLALMEIRKTAK